MQADAASRPMSIEAFALLKHPWLLSMALLAGCASTSPQGSVDAEACPTAISQLQARHCELSKDDERRMALGMTRNYDAWDRFFQDLADTAVLCAWETQPEFGGDCSKR